MTTQTNGDELEREKFEACILSMPFAEQDDVFRKDTGDYFHLPTRLCWKAWLARSKQEEP